MNMPRLLIAVMAWSSCVVVQAHAVTPAPSIGVIMTDDAPAIEGVFVRGTVEAADGVGRGGLVRPHAVTDRCCGQASPALPAGARFTVGS